MAQPKNIDEYIAAFPKDTQKILEQIRHAIKKAAPGAEETISYAIPTFRMDGHYLIYFAGYKNHVSLYPAPRANDAFKKELSAYKGGKGTVQFPLDKPLPMKLITRIVKFRIKTILEKVKAEDEVILFCRQWDEAMGCNKATDISKFMSDDWVIVGEDGISSKAEFLERIHSGDLTHHRMDSDKMRIKIYGNTAAVSSRGTSSGKYKGQSFDLYEWSTSIFIREEENGVAY